MLFKVIEDFTDLQDKMHEYFVGMTYPREGYEPTKNRIEQLSGTGNKLGRAVIEPIPEKITVTEQPDEVYVDTKASISEEPVEEKPKRRKRRD